METIARRALSVIGEFIEWWIGELWGLVPAPLRRRLSRNRQRVVLALGTRTAVVRLEAGDKSSPIGDVTLGDEPAAATSLAALLETSGLGTRLADGSAEATLRIAHDRSLNTRIRLPLAARSNLAEVVEFELDRHTPFRPAQVLFDARVVGEDSGEGLLDVAVILVPRATADEALAAAQRLGFSASRLDVAAPDADASVTGNLLRADRDGLWRRADKRIVAILAAAAAVLAIVAAGLPVVLAQRTEAALAERFDAVKQQALEAAALQKKIDALRSSELFLVDRRRTTPTVSQLLFDTTHVLPDNTWLASWQVAGDEIQLQGTAESAAALIGLLEHSKIFDRSSFKSPVTQEQSGGEHFNIATHVAQGKGS